MLLDNKIEIKCEYEKIIKIKDLNPHPKNRNQHGKEQITRLSELIKYQGMRHPVIVSNLSGFVVAGHGRIMALDMLGIKEVPVDFQDFKDDAHEYAFLTSDNAIALWAELDFAGINHDMVDLGPDFDIDLLGIKSFSLDFSEKLILEEQNKEKDESKVTEHECPRCKFAW